MRVIERAERFFHVIDAGGDGGDDRRLGSTSQGVLQQTRQL